ncbi:hypothetical protein K488DRAFT_89902 [Vararia minispora EC-137]|uniref:Uncharacterized protein n=1 Tax=Vararia minispora EC-137 TaxID=1314806 RepID=A0ACB8Q8X3_9AGAM|nr:hypothetical protein K488DRAFT_89902 [Vararia minispora EC-137]
MASGSYDPESGHEPDLHDHPDQSPEANPLIAPHQSHHGSGFSSVETVPPPFFVALTGYRLTCTALLIGLGIPKAVAAYRGQPIANTFDWIISIVAAVTMFWLSYLESARPEVLPRFFHDDYTVHLLLIVASLVSPLLTVVDVLIMIPIFVVGYGLATLAGLSLFSFLLSRACPVPLIPRRALSFSLSPPAMERVTGDHASYTYRLHHARIEAFQSPSTSRIVRSYITQEGPVVVIFMALGLIAVYLIVT